MLTYIDIGKKEIFSGKQSEYETRNRRSRISLRIHNETIHTEGKRIDRCAVIIGKR